MTESDSPLGRVRDAFALSLFHTSSLVQRESAALLRGDRDAARRLAEIAHRLVGTASSLGFDSLATPCRSLEASLTQHDDRWHARVFAVVRELDEAALPMAGVAMALRRRGTARALTILAPDPIDEALEARADLTRVTVAAGCPHPPRGVLFVDARRELMTRVRSARSVWGANPVVALAPRASEAETLLALRAGADMVHSRELDADAIALAAWSVLAPPLTDGSLLWFDNDSLRASAARAALEPLGAKLSVLDDPSLLLATLRKRWPALAVLDAAHPQAERLFDELASIAPSVPILVLGAARWSKSSLDAMIPLVALVKHVGAAMLEVLGPDDVPPTTIDATTQTVRLNRVDLGGLTKKVRPT
jgi:HPt (histidine-containing phosphotransfer) domain-containing protein